MLMGPQTWNDRALVYLVRQNPQFAQCRPKQCRAWILPECHGGSLRRSLLRTARLPLPRLCRPWLLRRCGVRLPRLISALLILPPFTSARRPRLLLSSVRQVELPDSTLLIGWLRILHKSRRSDPGETKTSFAPAAECECDISSDRVGSWVFF